MVRILHAADFHLDSPFAGLNPEQARQRRREARESLARLANFANAGEVDLVLLAGDLFDGAEIYPETAEALAEALGEIHGRVFISPGNHDYWDARGPYGRVEWPDNVHIFKSNTVEAVELPEKNCVVYGAAFTQSACETDLLRGFVAPKDDRIHIMVLHGDVDGRGAYNSFPRGEIAESGLDYLALGHIHAFSGIQKLWTTTWAYPGCPEGRGFDECGKHGVILGTVGKGEADLHFVNFARRKYEILTVDVTGRSPLLALEDALAGENTGNDIYRVIFTGETGVEGVDLDAVQSAMQERFYQLQLRDETRVAEDIWARAEEDSLRGLFLKNLLLRRDAAESDEARALVDRAARIGLAALEKRDL